MEESIAKLCFYCSEYAKITSDYPINPAVHDVKEFTPRCSLHWSYKCEHCKKEIHFNGISWCHSCKEFTCLNCADEIMIRENFLFYDYYYSIPCKRCSKENSALDYAEYEGTHPYQIGDLEPVGNVVVWLPIYKEEAVSHTFPHPAWGSERVENMGIRFEITRLDSLDKETPKSIWDGNAPEWAGKWPEGGDFNHKYFIIPEVLRLLDVKKEEKILDVACGEGTVTRHLAKKGAKLTGIDFSNMIDYGMERENKEKLGINYVKGDALMLTEFFKKDSFDKIVCNMAVMDISNHNELFQQISYLLKEDGIFVFSITHPCFAVPTCTSIRVPSGSQRNEDRIRIVKNYFEDRPTLVKWPPLPKDMLYFPRTIGEYINALFKVGLYVAEVSEPQATEDFVRKFPRHTYKDMDRVSYFLIIKTKKISRE